MKFRKSIKIAPGIKLNVSKSGVSTTVGKKGLSVTTGKKGTFLNTSLPGTGLSNRKKIFGSNSSQAETTNAPIREISEKQKVVFRVIMRIIGSICVLLLIAGISTKIWGLAIFSAVLAFIMFYRANKV